MPACGRAVAALRQRKIGYQSLVAHGSSLGPPGGRSPGKCSLGDMMDLAKLSSVLRVPSLVSKNKPDDGRIARTGLGLYFHTKQTMRHARQRPRAGVYALAGDVHGPMRAWNGVNGGSAFWKQSHTTAKPRSTASVTSSQQHPTQALRKTYNGLTGAASRRHCRVNHMYNTSGFGSIRSRITNLQLHIQTSAQV